MNITNNLQTQNENPYKQNTKMVFFNEIYTF